MIHTSNKFCSSKQAAEESGLYIHIFSSRSLSLFPPLLPVWEVLLLPQWLNPSLPVIASRGVLLVETTGSLFRHAAQSLSCSNATPLWGQRKLALTCICLFLQCVINSTERYTHFSLYVKFKHTSSWVVTVFVLDGRVVEIIQYLAWLDDTAVNVIHTFWFSFLWHENHTLLFLVFISEQICCFSNFVNQAVKPKSKFFILHVQDKADP